MTIAVRSVSMHVHNMRTRMPFKYGIATLTALPHLFVRVELEVGGERRYGIASDHLPTKWFTKKPDARFEDEVADMLRVARAAASHALEIRDAPTVFDLWRTIYDAQKKWADGTEYPPLLWAFGVTLVERAIIEAFCRATDISFAHAVGINTLGVRLGDIHEELNGFEPGEVLPPRPRRSIIARHTVGLSDPLDDDDIPAGERLEDGLPQSLRSCIQDYGITHFKIKIAGDPERDGERLANIATTIRAGEHDEYRYTLDGNETYHRVEPFRELWETLLADERVQPILNGLLFVEQPLDRSVALSDESRDALLGWDERPPMIIDESDASLDTAREALDRGYVGTSHKNCKGVIKGIANACLVKFRCRTRPTENLIMSGEDLSNVGPVALLQDLATLGTLGISHAERNGHHYFRGLSMYPEAVRENVLSRHGDLYRRHAEGFPTVAVEKGRISFGSAVEAPYGLGFELDPTQFTPLDEWSFDSLGLA